VGCVSSQRFIEGVALDTTYECECCLHQWRTIDALEDARYGLTRRKHRHHLRAHSHNDPHSGTIQLRTLVPVFRLPTPRFALTICAVAVAAFAFRACRVMWPHAARQVA
jgi:hypothetical protein